MLDNGGDDPMQRSGFLFFPSFLALDSQKLCATSWPLICPGIGRMFLEG